MKAVSGWTLVALAAVGVGAALWFRPAADKAPAAAAEEPVAQVRTELAREHVLLDTVNAFGEVSAGQLAGLSFRRAGQVTRLVVLPGDRIARGATLATLAPDPAVREAYNQALNAAAAARREADRLRQLLALQLATQSQVDAAVKAADDASGNVKALDAQDGGSGSSKIVAPFDGVVASVAVAQGDRVAAGAPILQLSRADALRVQIGIEPADSRRVHAGTKVSLQPVIGPNGPAAAIDAVVASVQDLVDPKTQLVSAIVSLPRQTAGSLVPGMKVRASLQVGTQTSIAVPRDAVLSDDHGDYVFQVTNGKAHRRAVKKALEASGLSAITGLADLAAPVVVVGNHELQDGMAVKEAAR